MQARESTHRTALSRIFPAKGANGLVLALAPALFVAGCMGGGQTVIQQAGSSTVLPIAEAWAAELAPQGIQVVVGGGGSGTGASKLCAGEIDIGDLSRPMSASEKQTCQGNGVAPEEWTVAYDGLSIVVNKDNSWVDHLTVEELKYIWRADSPAKRWNDVRAAWPDREIALFGPGSDSGTYDYFNEEILGKTCGGDGKQVCEPRSDYQASEDDNVLVDGVAGDLYSMGYFGFAYYVDNHARLKVVAVKDEGASAAVAPSFETIADGTYTPLSRPLFMYTDGTPEPGTPLHTYFQYAFGDGQGLIREIGYVELDAETLAAMQAKL